MPYRRNKARLMILRFFPSLMFVQGSICSPIVPRRIRLHHPMDRAKRFSLSPSSLWQLLCAFWSASCSAWHRTTTARLPRVLLLSRLQQMTMLRQPRLPTRRIKLLRRHRLPLTTRNCTLPWQATTTVLDRMTALYPMRRRASMPITCRKVRALGLPTLNLHRPCRKALPKTIPR